MAKKKKKIEKEMDDLDLVGVAVSVNPIVGKDREKEKRKKYQEGNEVSDIITDEEKEYYKNLKKEDQSGMTFASLALISKQINDYLKGMEDGIISEKDGEKQIAILRETEKKLIAENQREQKQEGGDVKKENTPTTEMYWDTDGNLQKYEVDPYKAIGHTVVEDKGRFDFSDKNSPETIGQRVERVNIEDTLFKPYEDKREGFEGAKSITTGRTTTSVKSDLSHTKHVAAHLQNMLLEGHILDLKELFKREQKQEGGEMDSQMTAMMMPTEETEEMDMLPDNQMEDQHLDFIINESLDNEEEMYLMEQLQADERLSMIFDKIMDTATEFSGSGPVEGLGTEVSDSIPARLSDGEFVMTAKATDEIGADNLERMMKDAEEASDNRQRVAMGGEIEKKVDRFGKPIDEDLTAEEIKRSMLSVNPRLR